MGLSLHNTLSRRVEPFMSRDGTVRLYCCGPTVHDFAHIGNFRIFVLADLLCRYLRFRGHQVRHVMNITDVDDKILRRLRETGLTLAAYTGKYIDAFFADLDTLRCHRPDHAPRATDHMEDIIDLVRRLVDRGIAYVADGSVWFSIRKYRDSGHVYGQLATLDFERMRPGERVRDDEYEKESLADFALWKARTPEDGEVHWASPWGEGRPGWHIECSAMSTRILGSGIDLHLGGEDLVFPHHEDEIAQCEGAGLDRPFVRCWVHGAHLLVNGRKMSKSTGNFHTLRDLVRKGYTGREIRFDLSSTHYRETCNFTLEGLDARKAALRRIDECVARLEERAGDAAADPDPEMIEGFVRAMDADLNLSAAWAVIFDWVREMNRLMDGEGPNASRAAAQLAAWKAVDAVLGLGPSDVLQVPPKVRGLVAERQEARAARDFSRADAIREELALMGWRIEDTPSGPKAKRS